MSANHVEDIYPLSPMQQGMLFHSIYAPNSGVYITQSTGTLQGSLDVDAFARAWHQLINRNSVLRTSFIWEDIDEPLQVVSKHVDEPLHYEDWRDYTQEEQQAEKDEFLARDRVRGFDLLQAPLARLAILHLAEQTYYFVWTFHHILLDGWSLPLLHREIFAFYTANCAGQAFSLPPNRPYRDYIAWLQQQDEDKAEHFWRHYFQGIEEPTAFCPSEIASEKNSHPPYGEQRASLSTTTTQALENLARQQQLTVNTLIQGALALLLSRYIGRDDLIFGTVVSGRPTALNGVESMVGIFINTLPVRVQTPPDVSLLVWLKQLQNRLFESKNYEHCPLVNIQRWSDIPKGTPLFDVLYVFENYPRGADSSSTSNGQLDLHIHGLRSYEQSNYPFVLLAGPESELPLKVVYDRNRVSDDKAARFVKQLQFVLEAFVANPESLLIDIPILTPAEYHQILVEWNDTYINENSDEQNEACIHLRFDGQVQRRADEPAIVYHDQILTYRALNRYANQLAHSLQQLGVGPEIRVGICAERSPEMIIGLLGVLKAGGAYVPLDPAYPQERLAFMIEDAQLSVLLVQPHLVALLPNHTVQTMFLDGEQIATGSGNAQSPLTRVTSQNLAYMIYTSGSTGQPKGTLLHHGGLCNFVEANREILGVTEQSCVLQFASMSFDASLAEIFTTLLTGAKLCLTDNTTLLSPPDLIKLLQTERVSSAILPPSLLSILPSNDLPHLRTVVSAGESCSRDIVRKWAKGRRFINAYGPTEATVGPTWYEVQDVADIDTHIPIGRPIANTQIYLLDSRLSPVPIDVAGELYIGGIGVARGYLNRPDLTAEKFIPNPYGRKSEGTASSRLYKTGDLARYRPDGLIEFLGRKDHQIKIRGFRVELSEIEAHLDAFPQVEDAVVVLRGGEDTGSTDKQLVAYLVVAEKPGPPINEIRTFLSEQLPDYMIPASFVLLDELPLTPNGKVDRRALPAPDLRDQDAIREYAPPRSQIELELVHIWEDVLNVRPIGVTESFFELGGHSLIAVRLMAQIKQSFERELPLATLFQSGTIEQFANILEQEQVQLPQETVVPIQPNGSKPPIFCVHGIGGEVLNFIDLANNLGSDQPFYGLQAPTLTELEEWHESIEETATRYVDAIQTFQPEGPYLLSGLCYGGTIAFEMARQFHFRGCEVPLLLLIDSWTPTVLPSYEDDAAHFADQAQYLARVNGKTLDLQPETLRKYPPDEQLNLVLKSVKEAGLVPPEIKVDWLRQYVQGYKARTRTFKEYVPKTYAGAVVLFRPNEYDIEQVELREKQGLDMMADLTQGWGAVTTGTIKTIVVPGYHETMCREPHVRTLAAEFLSSIDEALTMNVGVLA